MWDALISWLNTKKPSEEKASEGLCKACLVTFWKSVLPDEAYPPERRVRADDDENQSVKYA